MGSIHLFFSENILKAWLTATKITSPGLLAPCEWTPQGGSPSSGAESLEAGWEGVREKLERNRAWCPVQAEAVPGGLRNVIPPWAGALSTDTRVVQLSVPGTRRGSHPAPLLQTEQNRGLRGHRDVGLQPGLARDCLRPQRGPGPLSSVSWLEGETMTPVPVSSRARWPPSTYAGRARHRLPSVY